MNFICLTCALEADLSVFTHVPGGPGGTFCPQCTHPKPALVLANGTVCVEMPKVTVLETNRGLQIMYMAGKTRVIHPMHAANPVMGKRWRGTRLTGAEFDQVLKSEGKRRLDTFKDDKAAIEAAAGRPLSSSEVDELREKRCIGPYALYYQYTPDGEFIDAFRESTHLNSGAHCG